MAWIRPTYTRSQVDRTGEILANPAGISDDVLNESLNIVNNWRTAHNYPLHAITMTLRVRAKRVDQTRLIAQRIKRLRSTEAKLRRFAGMQLSRMHDIGGCRAVVQSVSHVDSLVSVYEKARAKNPGRGHEFLKKYDYIKSPKKDGYRSIHLVYKYRTTSRRHRAWNGLRIEIQIRSRLQHIWATAVETVDAFTGQALKSNIGEESWKRFFALMGSMIALKESKPTIPGTPSVEAEIKNDLKALYEQERMEATLWGMSTAVEIIVAGKLGKAKLFLLDLNTREKKLSIRGYQEHEQPNALTESLKLEKKHRDNPEVQVVLVSVGSAQALKRAYPNYYLDLSSFMAQVNEAIKA